jgi:hypothetical protein
MAGMKKAPSSVDGRFRAYAARDANPDRWIYSDGATVRRQISLVKKFLGGNGHGDEESGEEEACEEAAKRKTARAKNGTARKTGAAKKKTARRKTAWGTGSTGPKKK